MGNDPSTENYCYQDDHFPAPPDMEWVREQLRARAALLDRKLTLYNPGMPLAPYVKQMEFHEQGASKRERMLSAGNQQGKSIAGGAEGAMHATGRYPDWWKGKRFEHATRGWVAGISNEQTRDNAQRWLYGPLEAPGTGMIPPEDIVDVKWTKGISDFIDTMLVRNAYGGTSYISFKSYEQGRLKFQGPALHWIWGDEETPLDIYTECLARLTTTKGIIYITFTPLLGMTDVCDFFFPEPNSPDRGLVRMEIEDALHIPEAERAAIIAGYPPHERAARTRGIPMLGSGRVFPISEERIACDPIEIPEWWERIIGMDFGWDHPTAAVWLAINPSSQVVYVTEEYKESEETPVVHASAIRTISGTKGGERMWMPVAWPHDAHKQEGGIPLALQYQEHGVNMLSGHAQWPDGSISLDPGIMLMLDKMKTGKLRVFNTCSKWLDEFRTYHRKAKAGEGSKIVKRNDDLMSATRYGIMMLASARTRPENRVMPATTGMDYEPLAAAMN